MGVPEICMEIQQERMRQSGEQLYLIMKVPGISQ